MKNLRQTLIIFGLLFPVLLLGSFIHVKAQDEEPKVTEYIVIADTANLRSGAGTSFEKVGTVIKGDSIFIYDETSETKGWLKVYRKEEDDAFIADYLIERAPQRYYPANQEPVFTVSGSGKTVSDIFELPNGAYRIDAQVQDNSFILEYTVIEGNCNDDTIFNQLDLDSNKMEMSALLISNGCSLIFETDNVNSSWEFSVRDLLDLDALADSVIQIENGSKIVGKGRVLTMPSVLPEGVWRIQAIVKDRAFILMPQVLLGDCDSSSVFNELDFDTDQIEASTVYRVPEDGCTIYWETENVEKEWELTFEKMK